MKYLLLLVSASLSFGVQSQYSTFGSGNQTILGNSAGVASDGLTWGILVDTTGDGFDCFTSVPTSFTSLSTDTYVAGTDDYFVLGDISTTTFGGVTGSATTITYTINDGSVPFTGGESYALFWTDDATLSVGDSFGFIQAVADTTLNVIGEFIPTGNGSDNPTIQFRGTTPLAQTKVYGVPEPTSVALLGLGGLALLARRKR